MLYLTREPSFRHGNANCENGELMLKHPVVTFKAIGVRLQNDVHHNLLSGVAVTIGVSGAL